MFFFRLLIKIQLIIFILFLFLKGSIEEWLRLLRLDEYVQSLLAQGYKNVRDVIQLPWEDMEDIGIVKLGHQKKLLLAIKRVNDIVNGKWIPMQQQQMVKKKYFFIFKLAKLARFHFYHN